VHVSALEAVRNAAHDLTIYRRITLAQICESDTGIVEDRMSGATW